MISSIIGRNARVTNTIIILTLKFEHKANLLIKRLAKPFKVTCIQLIGARPWSVITEKNDEQKANEFTLHKDNET